MAKKIGYPALTIKNLPKPPHWSKAIGVGVVVMGLAIGTGELIMWPHLITKWGLGILWLALLGIGAQYFINQEVARHSAATAEGFFTTSARVLKWTPVFWFLLQSSYISGQAGQVQSALHSKSYSGSARTLHGHGQHLRWCSYSPFLAAWRTPCSSAHLRLLYRRFLYC